MSNLTERLRRLAPSHPESLGALAADTIDRLNGELDRANERWLDLMAENEDLRNRLIAEQDRNAILMSDNAILQRAVSEEGRANRMTYMYERAQEKLDAIDALPKERPSTPDSWSNGYAWAMSLVNDILHPIRPQGLTAQMEKSTLSDVENIPNNKETK